VYVVKTPWWLPKVSPGGLIWKMPATDAPAVYLSFDDGPHPVATPFVLAQLKAYDAKATFFCIGKCVADYPLIFKQTIDAGHSVGNHTYNHLNGWKTSSEEYIDNIAAANELIHSRAFRPPYGKISRTQAAFLHAGKHPWKVYMWSVLSADFDVDISPEKCLDNVLSNITPGAIVVFHDSAKAWDRLRYALPFVLDYCKEKGWAMNALPVE
jgi:peptidoglycan/xylan/chitin deacetylase (PgdA/CDA1 family)